MKTIPLVDSRILAQTFAMRRTLQHPNRLSEDPVMPDAQAYGTVLQDPSGQWRMWYLASPVYCEYYAQSDDGRNWYRPDLNIVTPEAHGPLSGPNAFLCRDQKDANGRWLVGANGPEGFCVLDAEQTPHPAAKARFTALYLASAETASGMHIAYSEDGIHWSAAADTPVIHGWRDTSSTFFYDARIRKYVWYGRPAAHVAPGMEANRVIARKESEDLLNWTSDYTVMDTDDIDADPYHLLDEAALRAGKAAASAEERAAAWAVLTEGRHAPGEKPIIRGRNRQWYGITAFPYAGLYLGMAWMYDLPTGQMWTELVHSFDGIDWRRETARVPFIPQIPDTCTCTMASPPITVGDELWLYDSVSNHNHHGISNPAVRSGIRMAVLKRDRWVAYEAGEFHGELLTQVVDKPQDLRLNAATRNDGWVRVEVTDADGRPIAGFAGDECMPFSGDSAGFQPCWGSGKKLADLPVSAIRLRIQACRASLFALHL